MRHWHFSIHPAGGLCLLGALLFVPLQQVLAAAVAMLLHEGAHLLCMYLCGVTRLFVEWTPLGFVAQAGGFSLLPPRKRLVIALAGVGASGAAALLCLPFAKQSRFVYELLVSNLSLWLVNSLPVLPLDGSRILLALAGGAEKALEKWLLILSYLCAAALCCLGLYSAMQGCFNPMLLLLGPYLAYAARESTQSSSIRSLRVFDRRQACETNALYPVSAYAAVGVPPLSALLRAVKRCPEGKYLLVHQVDRKSGRICGTLTEAQLHQKLFSPIRNDELCGWTPARECDTIKGEHTKKIREWK